MAGASSWHSTCKAARGCRPRLKTVSTGASKGRTLKLSKRPRHGKQSTQDMSGQRTRRPMLWTPSPPRNFYVNHSSAQFTACCAEDSRTLLFQVNQPKWKFWEDKWEDSDGPLANVGDQQLAGVHVQMQQENGMLRDAALQALAFVSWNGDSCGQCGSY